MNLYLLRHAIAAPRVSTREAADRHRPLTPEGEKKLRRVTRGMLALELGFDVILSSPYVRARQTAEVVAGAFGLEAKLILTPHLAPAGKPEALVEEIVRLPSPADNVLLVGHEPFLSHLISVLVFGDGHCQITLKKAGLCLLTAGSLLYTRCASFEWLLTPGQLSLMRV